MYFLNFLNLNKAIADKEKIMFSNKTIKDHLRKVAEAPNPPEKLEFDPVTGKLRVVKEGTNSTGNVVCTNRAAAGFFAKFWKKRK